MSETTHNGFINKKLTNSLKDTSLNNFDLGTTKMYRGVKPMFEQLGFTSPNFNNPSQQVYWNNIIPTDFDYFNLSGIEVQQVETDGDVGVTEGAKVSRESFRKIVIDEDVEQVWDNGHYYPVLPKIDVFGQFEDEVDVTLYGGENPPITNLDEQDDNLIFNLDLGNSNTDNIIDKSDTTKVKYISDFELKLDENLRLFNSTDIVSDTIETDNSEQAF